MLAQLIWYYETLDISFTTDKELNALDRPVSHLKPQKLPSPYASGFFSELHCLWLKHQKGLTHFKRRKSYFLVRKWYSLLAEKQLKLNPPEERKCPRSKSQNIIPPQKVREKIKYTRSRLVMQNHIALAKFTNHCQTQLIFIQQNSDAFGGRLALLSWQSRIVPLFWNITLWWEVLHTVMKNNNLSSKSFWKV